MTDSDRLTPVRWLTAILFLLATLAMLALPIISLRLDFKGGMGGAVLQVDATGVRLILLRDEPFSWAAAMITLAVLALGMATASLRGPVRAGAALGAALLAPITLTASTLWLRESMSPAIEELFGTGATSDLIHFRYGYWLVVALLVVTAAFNVPALTARLTAAPARASAA
jgi:hypothetical protein